jgi:formylglycine-generating enzyme
VLLACAAATLGAIAIVVGIGLQRAPDPARCPEGFIPIGSRCCSEGQTLEDGLCRGQARACPRGFLRKGPGCVIQASRVRLEPAMLLLGPGDWEALGVVRPRQVVVDHAFWIDRYEVTQSRWSECNSAGACPSLGRVEEEGLPARGMTLSQARDFCRWAAGRLPTEDEWILTAAGVGARRYPWGDTGAVCRRAGWGLVQGPCAMGGRGPDLAGIHRDDVTPEGVIDMSASVSEWVDRSGIPSLALGGSWRSSFAAELRTWHAVERDGARGYDDVGVRCVYAEGDVSSSALPHERTP